MNLTKKFSLLKLKFPETNLKYYLPLIKKLLLWVLETFIILFLVSLVLYLLLQSIYDRDNFSNIISATRAVDPARLDALEVQYNLVADNFLDGWATFIGTMLNGTIVSATIQPGTSVNDLVSAPFLISFGIGISAIVIGIPGGVILGLIAGKKPGGIVDKIVSSYIIVILSLPAFVIGLLLQYLGFATGNTNITFNVERIETWIMPIFSLAMGTIAIYARYIKTAVREELARNYVALARSKGASGARITFKHLLKPSMYPVATFLPAAVITTLTGAIITETVFQINGSGTLFLTAIRRSDIWVAGQLAFIYAGLGLIAIAIRDLIYPLIDPQARVRG